MKVLILSCKTGGGHDAAGLAMKEALEAKGHEAILLDYLTLAGQKVSQTVGDVYVNTVKTAPHVFGAVYKLGMVISRITKKSPVYYVNAKMGKYLQKYLEEADVVIYAGSLVNPKLLEYTKDICTIYNSAKMTLEEVLSVMEKAEAAGKTTVRLHTGDPCIYGAIREQMDVLDEKGIAYDYCPGVSAFCGAASALNLEYTLPDISQSVIITRMEGRTPVPPKESIQSFAAHQATMVVFLSTGMLEELSRRLIEGGYTADTPAAIVYKATWEDEKKFVCTVGTLAQTAKENHITKTALMIIGDCVNAAHYDRSKLYDPGFTTEFREATK